MKSVSRYWVWQMVVVSLSFLSQSIDGHGVTDLSSPHNSSESWFSMPQSEGFLHADGHNVIHERSNRARGRNLIASSSDHVSSSIQVGALIAFKDSVTSDPLSALDSWQANDTNPCLWRGVRCSSSNVIGLNLSSFQLVGILPEMLGYLNFLERLDLSNNFLNGSIPDSISKCSRLSYFNISYNEVGGKIPSQIGELSHILTLDASHNFITGVIPEAIGNCSLLHHLSLASNSLEGAIPAHIGHLSSLVYVDLSQNLISGSIPGSLGNLSSLSFFNVSNNLYLGGELPLELSELRKMTVFLLNTCNFGGAFPTWIANLTSLVAFRLEMNRFSGEIPNEIGQLSETLRDLVLYSNQITGPIPTAIVNCTSLVLLELQENNLTGKIPPDIGFLKNLENLGVIQNQLSGAIPSSISNCSALLHLTLAYNPLSRQRIPFWIESLSNLEGIWLDDINLYGEIPAGLGKLSSLTYLSLNQNSLVGDLPSSLGNLSFLQTLQVTDNQLQGEIPSEITGNLSSLSRFILFDNFFVGSIPSLSDLHELTDFEITSNLFTGYIDSNIGMWASQMETFTAADNKFSGPLPESIGNFSEVQFLDLSRNEFTGSIPPAWGNLTNLELLDLRVNKVDGVIPVDLTRCIQLIGQDLSHNRLEGSIPLHVGQIAGLESLYLGHNFLSGKIPSSFENLTRMQSLDLGDNGFSGTIPGGVLSKMGSFLISLGLSHNLFSGVWPPEFNILVNLQYLYVPGNNLSGPLLPGLAACVGLLELDVSLNNLTGMLPSDLGLLQNLEFFNASFNSFEGPIPTMGIFKNGNINRTSFLGNPKLCGSTTLVSQPCSLTSSKHSGGTFKSSGRWVLLGSLLAVLLLVLTAVIGTMCWWHEKKGYSGYVMKDFGLQGRIVLSEEEVMRIIQGGEDNVIGKGTKSTVYKGELLSGETIALKVLQNDFRTSDPHEMDERATEELLREVLTLAKLRHLNITKIFGLVVLPDVKALILEYIPRGSLHDFLYNDIVEWQIFFLEDRFKIILGIAESMVYLHHSFHDPIIHRDLKPSNILLGNDLQPKLNDFGISKSAKQSALGELEATASTLCGTFGYIPPEYATQTTVSTRGDVYSFGVVLLELLTRRNPTAGNFEPGVDLVSFVAGSFEGSPFEVLDSTLMQEWETNSMAKDQMMLLLRVGLLCTRGAAKARPDMTDVLEMLKQIKDMEVGVPRRSVDELAHDITVWGPPSDAAPNR